MAIFPPSQTIVSAAVLQIADSAGASADAEMQTRAFTSLNAATKHFNSRYKWNWLWTEAAPIAVSGPFDVGGITASAGQVTAALPAAHGIKVDDLLAGSGFAVGARVTATGSTTIAFSLAVTGFSAGATTTTATISRDLYDVPSDFKDVYSLRLIALERVLRPTQRRFYDRTSSTQIATGSPEAYELFTIGSKFKLRIVPVPSTTDTAELRYHRTMATATASASTATLDIPSDYDPYLIAWGKWHFLTDKGEGRLEQAKTWFVLAQEGLKTMLADQTQVMDEDLMFLPGAHVFNWPRTDRSTRDITWTYVWP